MKDRIIKKQEEQDTDLTYEELLEYEKQLKTHFTNVSNRLESINDKLLTLQDKIEVAAAIEKSNKQIRNLFIGGFILIIVVLLIYFL